MKKVLKWTGISLSVLLIGLALFGWWMNEPRPRGLPAAEADELAFKMLRAVDKSAWDTTRFLQWSFPGGHDYLWDKSRDLVAVTWKDNRVLLRTRSVTGKAFTAGRAVSGEAADRLIQKAWAIFCNDSWWLIAPYKVFDPGTQRSLVTLEDGRQGLMVEYASGGVTPGDAYVWLLDESGLPVSYKMWVKILPVGGLEFAWEDWQTLQTGARIAAVRKGPWTLSIGKISGAASLAGVGLTEDPFAELGEQDD